MRRRFPREVLLAVLVFAIYWLALCGLSFVMGCGDDHTLPPTAPSECECVWIPRKEAQNLRSAFPETSREWLDQCGDGAPSWLPPHQLPPGLRLHGKLPPEERWA